jgi:hypothetical protein
MFYLNRTIIISTVHEDQYTFFITSRSVLLRMRNVSNERCRENQTHMTDDYVACAFHVG